MEKANVWLLCPLCSAKTRIILRHDTVMKNFLLFCPKCKHQSVIDVFEGNIKVKKEPVAKMQSR